jgi:hypothetical protein
VFAAAGAVRAVAFALTVGFKVRGGAAADGMEMFVQGGMVVASFPIKYR